MKRAVKLLKALGDPTRLRIIKLLENGELCVCQLTAALDMGQSRISRHLSILKDAGLIEDNRKGKWVYYRIRTQGNVEKYLDCLKAINGDLIIKQDKKAVKKNILRDLKTPRLACKM